MKLAEAVQYLTMSGHHNQSQKRDLRTYLINGIIYTLIFWAFWQLSSFFRIAYAVSAFYPAPALNLALLYFFGWRYVPIVYFATCMATAHINPLWDQETFIWFNNLRQVICYGGAAYLLHKFLKGEQFILSSCNTLYFFVIAIVFSSLAAAGGILIYYLFVVLPQNILFDVFFSFWAGDITGILMLAPIAFLVSDAWHKKKASALMIPFWNGLKTTKILVVVVPSLFSVLFFAFIVRNPEMSVYGYLVFIPLIWVAATYGVVLASLAVLCSNLSVAGFYSLMEANVYTSNELHLIFATGAAIAIFIGVSRDERLRAENRAVEQESVLADMSRMSALGELSSTIAHEIATPLQVASSNLQMSIKCLERNDMLYVKELMGYQKETQNALRKAIKIHQRIRQSAVRMAHVQTGKTYLTEVLTDVQKLLKKSLQSSKVTIIIQGAESVRPVNADLTSMLQVFLNLFKNAISSMLDADSPVREIRCLFYGDKNSVQIEVSDTGPGFTDVKTQRIFDSFYTSKENGLGLGLPICRSILEGVGGSIKIDQSQLGANFILTLPAYKEQ